MKVFRKISFSAYKLSKKHETIYENQFQFLFFGRMSSIRMGGVCWNGPAVRLQCAGTESARGWC